jgi:hypothetical protein
MHKSQLLLFCLLALFSCRQTESGFILSPSKHYQLQFDINDSHENMITYKCVRLKLYNLSGELLSTFQTGASNYSKWATGWHPLNDTIILNSKDIGTYAYKINHSQTLEEVKITPELNQLADNIFNRKYPNPK